MQRRLSVFLLIGISGSVLAQSVGTPAAPSATEAGASSIRVIQAKWQNKSEIRGGASGSFKFTTEKQSANALSGKLDVIGGNCRIQGDPADATLDGDKIVISTRQSQTSCGVDIELSRAEKGGKYQFRQFGYRGMVTDVLVE